MEVTEREIIEAIKNHNCSTAEKVGDKNGAGTVCGGCKGIIERIIVEHKK